MHYGQHADRGKRANFVTVFRPFDDVSPVPGRIMVTSSSDVPMKGLVPLLEAVAKLRTERDVDGIACESTGGERPAREYVRARNEKSCSAFE